MPLEVDVRLPAGVAGGRQHGGTVGFLLFSATVDLDSIAANDALNSDETVTGLEIGDVPIFIAPTEALTTGVLFVPLGPVVNTNTLRFRGVNPTAAPVDAASVSMLIGVIRQ